LLIATNIFFILDINGEGVSPAIPRK